ncbi:MAG TPA: DJ-1/PfpI family protein, partial [Casimicrobiaceae bacterium]|nr:DJ-1/PfpI family protein [Casimicrobiaceae bacterium]
MNCNAQTQLSVGFVLQPEFTLIAFAGFVDALRLAADERDGSRPIRCAWSVLAPTSAPIRASCGVEIHPTSHLVDPGRFDYLVVVGGLLRGGHHIDAQLVRYLQQADAAGVPLVGICTGSFVLARSNLLRG